MMIRARVRLDVTSGVRSGMGVTKPIKAFVPGTPASPTMRAEMGAS